MILCRRQFLGLAAGVVALPALSRPARAEGYPARPVRIIVGFPPGTATDVVARIMADALSRKLGQQFFVENRPGGASNVGAEITRGQVDFHQLSGDLIAAGYHGDRERGILLYIKNWVSLQAYGREFEAGAEMRQNGVPCDCFECRKRKSGAA